MKKIVLLSMSLLLAANGYSLVKRSMNAERVYQQQEKTKIKKEELPADALKTLEADAFKGWTVVNTFKMKNGEYEVELKKGPNSQSIKFDKEGKVK